MRKIARIATFVFAIVLLGSVPASANEIEWEPIIYPQNQIFPSFIIGTAVLKEPDEIFPSWGENHMGDPQGIIGIWADNLPADSTVEVKVHETDFTKAARFKGQTTEEGELRIHPKISYKYDALRGVKQTVPMEITVDFVVNGESLGEKTTTATLRTINDCIFGVVEDEEEEVYSDYSWMFAAYVNEDHPWVDRTLKEALASKIVTSFDGYQSGEPEAVIMQIFAVWNTMQRMGLRYSSVTTTAASADGVHSQHVRLFEESVDAAQANCVDGTVLLAAVLRKIGLDASLVLVPGHMFLAVALDPEAEAVIGIETTLMGAADIAEDAAKRAKPIANFDPEDPKVQESWATFEAAVDAGTESLTENAEKFDTDDSDYWIINLEAAREMGILPISSKP